MATPSSTDPADEAGGEVVYSSDGLAPLPMTKPPPVPSYDIMGDDEVVDSEDLPPQLAFEIFQGKVYTTTQTNGKSPPVIAKETSLDRLARLQREIQEVEEELTTTAANSGREFDEQLVELATTLKTQLGDLSSTNRVMEHDDLSRLIRQQLESLKQPPSKAGAASGGTPTRDTGIVYELYGNASNPTTKLEDRLVQLERVVGAQSVTTAAPALAGGAASSTKTLLHRLEEMEALVKTMDAATMEATTTKAKVIRADLEAASKARNKLTATYKKEDSKMIYELHAQMLELEGLSGYLPSLVDRLQQLAGLHVQAGSFASRLEALETSSNQLGHTVSQLEGSVDQLAANLTQNLSVMEGNLKSLDERLNKL